MSDSQIPRTPNLRHSVITREPPGLTARHIVAPVHIGLRHDRQIRYFLDRHHPASDETSKSLSKNLRRHSYQVHVLVEFSNTGQWTRLCFLRIRGLADCRVLAIRPSILLIVSV